MLKLDIDPSLKIERRLKKTKNSKWNLDFGVMKSFERNNKP
jgi:hypothetical protein